MINTIKLISALAICVSLWLQAAGQTTVRGTIDPKIMDGGEVVLEVHRAYLRSFHNFLADIRRLPVQADRAFRFDIVPPDSVFYINVFYDRSDGRRYLLFRGMHPLLIRSCDDIVLRIDEHGVRLPDPDSPLTRYQVELASEMPHGKAFGKMDKEAYEWGFNSLMDCLGRLETLSNEYETVIPRRLNHILYDNHRCFHVRANLASIARRSLDTSNKVIDNDAYGALLKLLEYSDQMVAVPAETRLRHGYVDFLYLHEWLRLRAANAGRSRRQLEDMMLAGIISRYQALLKDQLLITHYLDNIGAGRNGHGEIDLLVRSHIRDDTLLAVFDSVNRAYDRGSPVFPFNFRDTSGRTVALHDLRGKVAILEFWFYGCNPCKLLSASVKKILTRYSGDDVVLVTVNVDRNRSAWIKGVRSGEYTAPESIDLHTGQDGYLHDMIRHYKFVGFPQLMIVDRQGRLVTATAPKPMTDKGKAAFLALLDGAL